MRQFQQQSLSSIGCLLRLLCHRVRLASEDDVWEVSEQYKTNRGSYSSLKFEENEKTRL
jgi:hypothetical protein